MEKDTQEFNHGKTIVAEAQEFNQTFGNLKSSLGWLSFLAFFSVLNEMVFNVSLPDIAHQFGIPPSVANWVNTSFIISFAVGSLLFSKISDMYGMKKLLVTGLLIYSGGSLLGIAGQYYYPAIIAARFIQGAGASAVPALIMVIVARYVGAKDRGKAFGLIGSMVAMGEGIGPAIGGIIAGYIHWSFLFVLPMMTLISLPFFVKSLPGESAAQRGKIDIQGASLLSIGIVMFTLYTTGYQWIYIMISLALFLWFALHIRRANQPFIEPSLFVNRKFIAGVLAGGMLLGTVAGFISMIPYMMRDVHHMATAMIGSQILLPGTVSVIFFGFIGGTLVDKRGIPFVWRLGLLFICTSFLLISLFADKSPWLITGALVLTFGGLSFVKTVISTRVSETLNPEEAGAGMGLLNFACFLSEGIGIAIVGGMLTSRLTDFPFLPTVTRSAAYLYSNLILIFIIIIFMGWTVYTFAYRDRKK